jgi:hypothetical protein
MKQVIDANLNNNSGSFRQVDVGDRETYYSRLRHWNN